MTTRTRAFTLVELLVVIAIIGVLLSLLLPAVQSARESARSAQCQHHLAQLIIGVNNYEMAHTAYPTGTVAAMGPVPNQAQGYHHGWTTQLLPYIEQGAVFRHVDLSVSVYDPANANVRAHNIAFYRCPSSWLGGPGYSDYAGVQHDVEAPIDANNDGVFYLNSRVRYQDISDGTSQTFFIGEKLTTAGDLGWMSGTRAIMRNTGTRLNAAMALSAGSPQLVRPNGRPGSEENGGLSNSATDAAAPIDTATDTATDTPAPDGGATAVATSPETSTQDQVENAAPDAGTPATRAVNREDAGIRFGQPIGPLAVGGFASDHRAGANFAFGDGSIRFISESISIVVYQQLGNRHDGQLIDEDY